MRKWDGVVPFEERWEVDTNRGISNAKVSPSLPSLPSFHPPSESLHSSVLPSFTRTITIY